MRAAGSSATAAPPPLQGPSGAPKLMVERAVREPEFANWLLQVASAHASGQGPSVAPAASLSALTCRLSSLPRARLLRFPPLTSRPLQPPQTSHRKRRPSPCLGNPGPTLKHWRAPLQPAAHGDTAASEAEAVQGLSLDEFALLDAMLE